MKYVMFLSLILIGCSTSKPRIDLGPRIGFNHLPNKIEVCSMVNSRAEMKQIAKNAGCFYPVATNRTPDEDGCTWYDCEIK